MNEKKINPIKRLKSSRMNAKVASNNDSTNLKVPDKLKLLFTIVERQKAEFYLDYLENFEINMQTVIFGKGTAPSNVEYLSMGENGKAIIISVVKEDKIKDILNGLEDKFAKIKNGKGIAYTIPIASTIGVLIYQFLSNNKDF